MTKPDKDMLTYAIYGWRLTILADAHRGVDIEPRLNAAPLWVPKEIIDAMRNTVAASQGLRAERKSTRDARHTVSG